MVVPTTIRRLSTATMSHVFRQTRNLNVHNNNNNNNHNHNHNDNHNDDNNDNRVQIVSLQEQEQQKLDDNHDKNHDNNDEYDNEDTHSCLSDYFLKQQEIQQADELANVWFGTTPTNSTGSTNLPFHCTACGKCCQTKGSVWMSPDEIETAATLLQLSTHSFITKYTSQTILSNNPNTYNDNDNDNYTNNDNVNNNYNHNDNHNNNYNHNDNHTNNAWAKILQNEQHHCVFLSTDNKCQIYLARPTQCSTYPFWTKIMESKHTWNAQVRVTNKKHDDNTEEGPIWTKEQGGCEGMTRIPSTTATITNMGVDPKTALQRLQQYERDERRFPRGGTICHTPKLPESPTQT